MIKFLMNLFKIGKPKEKEYINIDIDRERGTMFIETNKELSPEEILEILREQLGDD